MKLRRSHSWDVRLEMTPLIDVVFLILTFFVFSLVLMVRADTLGIDLPELPSAEVADRSEVISLVLTAEGELRLDTEPVTLDSLAERIAAAREQRPGARVLFAADAASASGDLLRVLDRLTAAGIEGVSFPSVPTDDSAGDPQPVDSSN